jgi:hypothetical protein
MVINMNETRLTTIVQIEEFLRANAAVDFLPSGDEAGRNQAKRGSGFARQQAANQPMCAPGQVFRQSFKR